MSTTGLRTGTRLSLDEFLALGETDGKWELDDGVLYIMSSGTRDHQFLILQFSRRLDDYLDSFEQPVAHFYHEMTTILSRELQRAPEPDIVIIREGRPGVLEGRWVEGAPDIVVEILSTDRNRTWSASGRFTPRPASSSTGPSTLSTTRSLSWNCGMESMWNGRCLARTTP